MDGFKILEIARRTAWKYKKSGDPHHSDTYTFNEHTLIDFVQKVQAHLILDERNRCAEIAKDLDNDENTYDYRAAARYIAERIGS